MQDAKYVAELIKDRTTGAPIPGPFKYFDKGGMATIGHKAAAADAFGDKFTGCISLSDVRLDPRRVPGRLGQPAGHPVQVDTLACGSARADVKSMSIACMPYPRVASPGRGTA